MKKTLGFLMLLAIGGVFGYLGASFLLPAKDPDAIPLLPEGTKLFFVLLTPLIWLVVVGWHELGHVVAGRLNNFDFYGLTVGPLSWKPGPDGRVRFAWNKSLNLGGGVAVMLPAGEERLRQRFTWFVAGGPLSSLVLTGLLALLSLAFTRPSFALALCYATGALSAFIFLVTALPFRAGGFSSDGLRVLNFLRNDAVGRADLMGLRAMTHLRAGLPIELLPLEELNDLSKNPDVPEQQRVTADYYRYLFAVGTGYDERAETILNGVLERIDAYPAGTHGGFYLEQAYFLARHRGDLPGARAALEKYEPGPLTDATAHPLALAAIAEREEDYPTLAAQLPLIRAGMDKTLNKSRLPQLERALAHWEGLVQ